MTLLSCSCNNPNTYKITNNDNFNIFYDNKLGIVFFRGTDIHGNTKQIKLGNCDISYLLDQINIIVGNVPTETQHTNLPINCNIELFKFIGLYTNFFELNEYSRKNKIENLSIGIIKDCVNTIYLYSKHTNSWQIIGSLLNNKNLENCKESISSYSKSSNTCTDSEFKALFTTEYLLYQPEFINTNKLKQSYSKQLNEYFEGLKYYIKFTDINYKPIDVAFIESGKYLVEYTISFYYNDTILIVLL